MRKLMLVLGVLLAIACFSWGCRTGMPSETVGSPPAEEATLSPAGAAFLTYCRNAQGKAKEWLAKTKAGVKSPVLEFLSDYNEMSIVLDDMLNLSGIYYMAHPDAGVRTAGETCEQEIMALQTEISLDRDLFEVFDAASRSRESLPPDVARLIEKVLLDFKRTGVDRDEKTRERIRVITARINELSQTFDRTLRDDTRYVEVADPKRLAGLPADFIAQHPADSQGIVKISTDWLDYLTVMSYAEDVSLREQEWKLALNLGYPQNDPVLIELLTLRYEMANLLGYTSWADYATEILMVHSGANAQQFIDKIASVARPLSERDKAILLEYKRRTMPDATKILPWEGMYLVRKVKAERFHYDSMAVREYFDVKKVQQGVLDIASLLFGIRFVKTTDPNSWHESVQVFDVYEGEQRIARIHLDLYPRENKYKSAAMFSFRGGLVNRRMAEGAIIANFPDPEKSDGPALLEHTDVTVFFHEFGHLLHYILSGKQRWIRFSGAVAEWDFVEVPSQLFEEWAWDKAVLRSFATNAKDEALPEDLADRMRDSEKFAKGFWTMHQMYYSAVALALHEASPKNLDLQAIDEKAKASYSPYPVIPDTHMTAGFGHLVGYSSNYYTYMWSLVIAKSFARVFTEHGFMDTKTAMAYRKAVFAPGGTRDGEQCIRDFLGHDFSYDAFEAWLK